jgi:hypothetical protein
MKQEQKEKLMKLIEEDIKYQLEYVEPKPIESLCKKIITRET